MRRTPKIAAAFTLAALVLVLVWACSSEDAGPTSSTPVSTIGATSGSGAAETTPNEPATPPANPPTTPPQGGELTATRPSVSGSTASSTFTNTKSHAEGIRMCSYECLSGNCKEGNQKLIPNGEVNGEIPGAGATRDLEVPIACVFQADAFGELRADAKCPEIVTYETDFSKFGLDLLEAKLGSRKNDPDCQPPPPECPANAYAKIDAMIPPQGNHTSACPPTLPVVWSSSTNLATKKEILPVPPLNVTGPGTGTVPLKENGYSLEFRVEGYKAGGKLCATGSDILRVPGCKCTPCETQTRVVLKNELIKDGQTDAYRIRTSFTMAPPGKYRLLVKQGGNVLRDTTSTIQQAYLSPGAAETPLACDSGPVDVVFYVLDGKCGEDVVCETYRDNVKIPECECVKPKPPECQFGDPIWDADKCEWTCPPCVKPEPPKCQFGDPIWDADKCKWECPECEPCVDSSESLVCVFNSQTNKVACKAHASHDGRIVMKQSGQPIFTADFTGDKAFFSPVLPCDKNPVNVMLINRDSRCGEPVRCGVENTQVIPDKQCPPGFHLHPEECKCYCDPVGEPLCPDQVWNEETCQWEGDCDICHVSNGGQPGECDWNLQEQDKKYTPGHALHMDPENQCPPDYFGKCDNRYEDNPHACQSACQPK